MTLQSPCQALRPRTVGTHGLSLSLFSLRLSQTLFSLRLASTAACELTSAAPRLPSRAPLTNLRVYRWYASPNIACCRSAPHAATDARAEKTQHTRRARSHRSSCRTDSARVFLFSTIASHCRSQRVQPLPPWYRWYAVAFSRRTARRSRPPLLLAACCRCLWSRSLLAAAAARRSRSRCRSRRSPLAAARHCRCRWSRRPLVAAAATNITKRSHADCSLARRA